MEQSESNHELSQKAEAGAHPKPINIIVEVNGRNKHLRFDASPVTGRQIRESAGVPLTDDLTRLIQCATKRRKGPVDERSAGVIVDSTL